MSSKTSLAFNGVPTEIHIQECNTGYIYNSRNNKDHPGDFKIEFSLMKQIKCSSTSSKRADYNYSKLTHKSYPLPFNPNQIYEANNIDFSLCVPLQLMYEFDLRREVKRRIASYVESNPRPTTLSVTIVRHENKVPESKTLKMLRKLLKKVKVEDMEGFKEGDEE